MANRPEKQNRKVALDRWKSEQRAAVRRKLPLPNADLEAFFDYLNSELLVLGCDPSRRICLAWITQRGVSSAELLSWLDDNGGFCDCTALANAKQYWMEAIHDVDWE